MQLIFASFWFSGTSYHLAWQGGRNNIPVSADPWLEIVPVATLLARTVRYLCGENLGAD